MNTTENRATLRAGSLGRRRARHGVHGEVQAKQCLPRRRHLDARLSLVGFGQLPSSGGSPFPDLLNVLGPEDHYVVAGAIAGPLVRLNLRTVYLNIWS